MQTTTFNITYFDNLEDDEEKELFKRLNAGKPLTAKNRLIASCKDIKSVLDIGNNELFHEMLTDKAKENKNHVSIIMKCWTMLNKNISEISFESKTFNPIVENTEISIENKIELNNVFAFVHDIHEFLKENGKKKIAKIIYTETHLVSLMPYFKNMLESGVDLNLACDWLIDFYSDIPENYNESCKSGVAKSANIIGRDTALRLSYNEFFAIG